MGSFSQSVPGFTWSSSVRFLGTSGILRTLSSISSPFPILVHPATLRLFALSKCLTFSDLCTAVVVLQIPYLTAVVRHPTDSKTSHSTLCLQIPQTRLNCSLTITRRITLCKPAADMVSLLDLLVLLCAGSCVLAAPPHSVPYHFKSPERNRFDREGTKWLHEHRNEILPPHGHHDGIIDEVRPIIQYRDEAQPEPKSNDAAMGKVLPTTQDQDETEPEEGLYESTEEEFRPMVEDIATSKTRVRCDDKDIDRDNCEKPLDQKITDDIAKARLSNAIE